MRKWGEGGSGRGGENLDSSIILHSPGGFNLQPSLETCVLIRHPHVPLPSTLCESQMDDFKVETGTRNSLLKSSGASNFMGVNSKLFCRPQSLTWPGSRLPYALLCIPPTHIAPSPEPSCSSLCLQRRQLAHPAPPRKALGSSLCLSLSLLFSLYHQILFLSSIYHH